MKRNSKFILAGVILAAAAAITITACEEAHKKHPTDDSFLEGSAPLVCDASFSPIVDEELYVFKALYPKAHPNMIYASENEVLNYLFTDSIRFAILSRNLTAHEVKVLRDRTLPPIVNKFAVDAVTLIVNDKAADTAISVSDIKKMLKGQAFTNRNIVFDNPNSSLYRYLKDFSGSDLKQKNIYGLKSNKEVIKYVSEHPEAIGVVGFAWLNDPDKDYADYVHKVKILAINNDTSKKLAGKYFRPSQETLYLNEYPLTRSLYLVNCTGRVGLATGFASFIESDRGQRIILKSGLLPDSIPHRDIVIDKEMKY